MKKYLALVFAMLMSLAFVSCGEDEVVLEHFISFTAAVDGEESTPYAWGDNTGTYAEQSGNLNDTVTLKAQDSKDSAQSIEIVLKKSSGAWDSVPSNITSRTLTLKLGGKTYTGNPTISITEYPASSFAFDTPVEGNFSGTFTTTGGELKITNGEIKLLVR